MLKSFIVVVICTTAISSSINPVVAQNTNNLFIADATTSSKNAEGNATDVLDNNDNTWWSADGKGQYLELNTGGLATVNAVKIKFYDGDKRTATFDVDVSTDGISWKRILTNQNSQRTADLERYGFTGQSSRYIRLVNRGDAIAIRQVVVEGVPKNKTYYVDCTNGSDTNNQGTTPSSAWQTLNPVNRWSNPLTLNPGDSLLLKRGCTFAGPLNARWTGSSSAPIAFGAYGSSNLPLPAIDNSGEGNEVVKITGQYQTFEYIKVRATKPGVSANAQKCRSQPVGWRTGFDTRSGSSYNIVRYSEASGFTAGIRFGEGSHHNKALYNALTFNNVMDNLTPSSQYDDDSGAWGILLNGDNNEVAYNYFEGNVGCSEDYGVDGASIEVYKGSSNYIHHNQSWRESTFTELGGSNDDRAENNKYAYNTYSAFGFASPYINSSTLGQLQNRGGEFLSVRGYKSGWGANPGTEFYHNTGYWLNGGILCIDGCSPDILQARNNIMVASQNPSRYLVESDAKFGESNNLYWQAASYSGPQLFSIGGSNSPDPTSKKVDPVFIDPANGNFRLQSSSSAINTATNVDLSWANPSQDIYGNSAPRGSARDIGAAEY